MSSTPTSSAKPPAGYPGQSPAATWTESDELGLLRAVLEIAMEPLEAFDPRDSPFARIERNLGGGERFTRAEILAKVKELRSRYEEEKRFRIRTGESGGAHNEDWNAREVFDISHRVWGSAEVKNKGNRGTCQVQIDKLLSVESNEFEQDTQSKEHLLAIKSSSSGEKHRLECCQTRTSSPNGLCSSNSASHFCTEKSGELTKKVDLMALRHSSNLEWRARNDANKKPHEQHQELIVESNRYQLLKGQSTQYQESLMVMSNETVAQPFISGTDDFLSHVPETPQLANEANGRTLLANSSRSVAEKRLGLAVEVCTEGKGREFASSSFSHPSLPPVQHFVPGFSSSDTDPYAALWSQLSDLFLQFSEMIIARREAMHREHHNNMIQFSEMIIARREAMHREHHNNMIQFSEMIIARQEAMRRDMVNLCSAIRCVQRSLDDFFSRRGWPLPVPTAYARPLPPTGPPFDPWMPPQDASMASQPVAKPEEDVDKKDDA